jgi:hypothetical protein
MSWQKDLGVDPEVDPNGTTGNAGPSSPGTFEKRTVRADRLVLPWNQKQTENRRTKEQRPHG